MVDVRPSVPWGRLSVPWIPVPPFSSREDRAVFLTTLTLYLNMLDPSGPSPATTALVAELGSSASRSTADGSGGTAGHLTATELRVAISTYFPAPWTPSTLAAALARLTPGPHVPVSADGGRSWSWDGDPLFFARPGEAGGWRVVRNERGARREFDLEHEGDLVLLWMDHFGDRHGRSFARDRESEVMADLAPAVRALAGAAEVELGYPSHVSRRKRMADVLGGESGR